MPPDDLFTARGRQPFLPFRLHVSDGSSYDIRHPEMLWITRRTAYVGIPGEGPIPERAVTIAMIHVSRLEELPAAAAGPSGDGAAS